MYAGRVVEEAPVAALFAHQKHPYTRGLLACIPNAARDRDAAGGRLRLKPDRRHRAERDGAAARLLLRAALRLADRALRGTSAAHRRRSRRISAAAGGMPSYERRRRPASRARV